MTTRTTRRASSEYPQGATTEGVGPAPRDAVALRAYALFEQRGREPGRDVDDWLRAEHEIREALSHI